MTRAPSLLLVGGTDETVAKARPLVERLLVLQHPTKVTPEQERLADVLTVVDYTDWNVTEPVVRRLRERPGFGAALSLTEPGLETAGRVIDRYRLRGTGYQVARRVRDKWDMRQHLAGRDPAAVAAAPLRQRGDLAAFGDQHGYPFIVKPTDATASIGVFRVDGPDRLDAIWAEVDRLRGTRTDRISSLFLLQEFLMEEYVDGPEYSVESFSFGGRHVIITVTEKFTGPGHFAELGHAVPARISGGDWGRLRDCARRFLDLMGVTDGVCHTEVRLSASGPKVIEGHTRLGGDAIPDLVEAAYGIDLTTLALRWALDLPASLPDEPPARAGACSRFLAGGPGTVESVDGAAAARAAAGVITVRLTAKPGDVTRPLRDNWDRLGLIATTGPDTAAAIARGEDVIASTIKIRVAGPDGGTTLARATELGLARTGASR